MNWFDIVIVAAVSGSGLLGFRIGLMRAVFLLAAFILGALLGAAASSWPSSILEEIIPNTDVRELTIFATIFLPVFAIVNIIGSVACKSVRSKPLQWVDCLIGSVLGLLIGIIFTGLVIAYLTKSPTTNSDKWLEGSYLVPNIRTVINPILREFLKKKATEPVFALNGVIYHAELHSNPENDITGFR